MATTRSVVPRPLFRVVCLLAAAATSSLAQERDLGATIDLGLWPDRRDHVVLPPDWSFGVLYGGYTTQAGSLEKIDRLIELGLPIDAYWIDSWFWDFEGGGDGPNGYIDFVGDREAYPDPEAMWDRMEELGVKSGVWVWDRILQDGNESVWDEFMDRGYLTTPWVQGGWHTDGKSLSAIIDFDNPKAAAHWQERMRPFFEMGVDFLKIDAQATVGYMEAAFEATQRYGLETEGRGFILSHANTPGDVTGQAPATHQYRYPTKWTGDASVRWSQPSYPDMRGYQLGGLAEQVRIFATQTDKGHYPFLAMDTGGFDYGEPSDELFTRWSQFASFTPVMCVFGAHRTMESNTPYLYGDDALDSFREHTRLRLRLFPYIYSYAHRSRLTEQNIIRPSKHRVDQYHFGDAFLVAPVVEPAADSTGDDGVQRRHVEFPAGVWYDFWTDAVHDQGTLGTSRRLAVASDRLPLFVRDGSIVPMRDEARSVDAGTSDDLEVHIWPGERGRFDLFEDDGSSTDYLYGRLALTRIRAFDSGDRRRVIIEPVEGGYDGMPETRRMTLVFRRHGDARVEIEGVPADARIDPGADPSGRALRVDVEFRLRDGVVVDLHTAD